MKKSLTRLLARMAKDGDVETVAEIIEEMIADPEETAAEPAAETAAEPPVTVEVPENREITIDEDTFSAILGRLDRMIELLAAAAGNEGNAPGPFGQPEEAGSVPSEASEDEDPAGAFAEEISEMVEEAVEAAESAENPGPAGIPDAAELAEIVEEVLDPAVSSAIGESDEEECGHCVQSRDALRAALMAVRPALAQMPARQRRKVCADLAARLRTRRKAGDSGIYAALAGAKRSDPKNTADLGRRIMAGRNANYKK